MSKNSRDNTKEGFEKTYGEPFKTVVLRDGAKFHAGQMSPEQVQMVEGREADARAVARFVNMPPAKLGIEGSVSYGSAEESNRNYLTDCLGVWLSAESSECESKLLTRQQLRSRSHYMEHNVSKLIEIDGLKQAQILAIERQNEIISANEWRRKINLNRRDGGDDYGNPNVKSTTAGGAEPAGDPPSNSRIHAALENVLAVAHTREQDYLRNLAGRLAKNRAKYVEWVESDWASVRALYARNLGPACEALNALDGCADAGHEAARVCGLLQERLRALIDPPHKDSELAANVAAVFDELQGDQ